MTVQEKDPEQGLTNVNDVESSATRPLPATHHVVATPVSQWRSTMRGALDAMEERDQKVQDQTPQLDQEVASPPSTSSRSRTAESYDPEEPTDTKVLNAMQHCPANTLEESIDTLISTSPVIMFERTWCLFSRDARDFLLYQLGVSIVTVPVDKAQQGEAIAKYVRSKTGYKTLPVIFVKGEFLGGFEDVNKLYSTGELEGAYLHGLTHADRCEMEVRDLQIGTQPFFWFPTMVNGHAVRMTGVLTCLCAVASALLSWTPWGRYIALGLLFDFATRILAGSRLSVLGRVASLLVMPLEPKPRVGRPKQFAACCGLLFSLLATLGFFVPFSYHSYVGAAFVCMLAIAAGAEGFLDFCLGCVFFKIGVQIGLIPK